MCIVLNMWKVDQILQVFAPFDCLNCKTEGLLLCKDCQRSALPSLPQCCYKCLTPTVASVCYKCRATTDLSDVWAATIYKDVIVQLVGRLKFARTQAAAHIIAQIMVQRLPSFSERTVVIHVPTANQRVRQRGYDQAQLIAREFARSQGLGYQALLRRQGKTRQVGANRTERLLQLQNAYYCPKPDLVYSAHILLVDDVLTTGATIETAAKVLKAAGAAEVRAVTFAQKL